jgi:hypothetical protein
MYQDPNNPDIHKTGKGKGGGCEAVVVLGKHWKNLDLRSAMV